MMATPETAIELTGAQILEPGTTYIISVGTIVSVSSCRGENVIITCETSPSLPTQPPGM